MGDFAVERDRLDGAVSAQQDRSARRFVAAARLHPDITVLDQIEAANTVLATDFVEGAEYFVCLHLLAVDGDNITLGEFEVKVLGLIRCLFRRNRPPPHRLLRFCGRIFQVATFVGNVQQVGIHRIWRATLLVLHVDFDAMLLGIGHELLTRHQIPLAPRRNDLDARLQRVGTELETHLVVTLAGRAMTNGVGTGFIDDLDQALGDQRTGDRGTKQVLAFIDSIGTEHRENEVADKFLAHVVNVDVLRLDARLQRLGARRLKLFPLAEVGRKGDHFALVHILQPLEDDRGIQTARIGQYNLLDVAHFRSLVSINRAAQP